MTDYRDFLHELPASTIAEVCQVDVATARRWQSGNSKPPGHAEKLLRFTLRGDAAALFGKEWAGVEFSRYGLSLPGWRNPIPPGELRASFWRMQQVEGLRRECERLARELEHAHEAQAAAEDRADWLHRQLVSESRLALMLADA